MNRMKPEEASALASFVSQASAVAFDLRAGGATFLSSPHLITIPMAEIARDLPTEVPDEELVARIRGGEPALFEEMMRRYNQRLYRVVRAILKDEHETEDVMQQAYVQAF